MWEIQPDKSEGEAKRRVVMVLSGVVVALLLAFAVYDLGGFGSQGKQSAPEPKAAVPQATVATPPQLEELLDLSKLTLDRLKELSSRGNAEASFEVGERYRLGKGCIRDAEEADRWYAEIVNTADPDTMFRLAEAYLASGRSQSSRMLFSKAALWGVRSAQLQLAYRSPSDKVEFYAWFKVCSSWGDVASTHAVERFEGDPTSASSASLGRLRAREILGQVALSLDIRSTKSPTEILRKRAAAGDHAAMIEMADVMYVGKVCRKNEADAMKLYQLAADAGCVPAFARLAHFYQLSTLSDPSLSRSNYLRGAIAGDLFCQKMVALYYEMGAGAFVMHKNEAYAWYNILAATGDAEAAESRDQLESLVDAAFAQKRSRELLKEIEANKAKK